MEGVAKVGGQGIKLRAGPVSAQTATVGGAQRSRAAFRPDMVHPKMCQTRKRARCGRWDPRTLFSRELGRAHALPKGELCALGAT